MTVRQLLCLPALLLAFTLSPTARSAGANAPAAPNRGVQIAPRAVSSAMEPAGFLLVGTGASGIFFVRRSRAYKDLEL